MKSSVLRLVVLLLALACVPTRSWAQANQAQPPGQISFQGFLTDANGIPLATNTPQNFNVLFNIYAAPNGGTPLWGEAQVVTVSQGYFTVLLGVGSSIPSSATFHTNDLTYLFNTNSAQTRYVGLTVSGVSSGELAPRLQLLSSPFALLAANSVNANTAAFATNAANAVHANNADNASAAITSGTATNALNLDPNFKIQPSNLAASIGLWSVSGANLYYNAGNIGIGTAAPAAPLSFANTIGEKIILYNGGPTSYGFGVSNSTLQIHADVVGSDIAFGYGSSTNLTEAMRIKGTGNVGIGTKTPAVKLDVNGATAVRGAFTYQNAAAQTVNPVGSIEETTLRIVRGTVPTAIGLSVGATASGAGWSATTVNINGTTTFWHVTFTHAFSATPTIMSSVVTTSYWGNNGVSGEVISNPGSGGVYLRADAQSTDSNGGPLINCSISFVAIGN